MIWDNLPHVVDVLGPQTTATDAGGGVVVTWPTTRAANVPCLINAPFDSASDRFAQDNLIGTWTLAMAGTVTVARGDLLSVVSADVVPAGTKLRVTGLKYQPGVGGIDSHLHVSAERVE